MPIQNSSLLLAIRISSLLCIATALNGQAPQQEPKFALEMHAGGGTQPHYALVPAEPDSTLVSTFFNTALVPLAGENTANSSHDKPCALGLEVKEDGEAISINAFLYFGAMKPDFDDLHKHPKQLLGNYSLRLDEIVVLDEMKKFALEPYTIKLLTAQVPLSGTPVLSEVPSLHIAIEAEDRTTYKLVVHNLSAQAVTGLMIERGSENQRSSLAAYNDGKPLIAPGGHYKMPMTSKYLDCTSPDSSRSEPAPCPIVLKGALFADGTRAGDPAVMAGLELARSRTSGPRRRLRELLQNTVNDPALSDAEKITKLRAEIPNLPEKSDPALDELRARYPELSDEEWDRIKTQNNNLFAEKQMVLERLDRYEESSPAALSVDSLTQWLRRYGMVD